MSRRTHVLASVFAALFLALGMMPQAHAIVSGGGGGGSSSGGGGGTVTTFNASGQFANGNSLSGTITINTTQGTIQSVDLTAGTGSGLAFNASTTALPSSSSSSTGTTIDMSNTTGNDLNLGVPVNSLVGYTGGSLMSLDAPGSINGFTFESGYVLGYDDATVYLTSGSLTVSSTTSPPPTVSAPEPGSLAIFGAGVFGLLGFGLVSRRKLRRTGF